ncbi:tetratricopeptide repeat protein [bacterium]|nr:tetratricopeptide repeat protein [bacterium]
MLVNIKQAIKDGRINQRRKIYIPDDITYYLPGLCWNIVMGERFMEGNYKWIFPKEQISLFVDNLKDAYWTIDKRNFEIITKKQIPQGDIPVINKIESPWYIDVGKDRLYFDVGDYCEKRGNYQKAEKLYKKALEVNPVYLDAYEALGNLYMKLKRFKDAEVMFKKMAALEGDGADAYIKLGYWCRMYKMFDEALKMYKKAQQIDPFNAWLYVEYGNYFLDQGIYDRAEEMYKYALSLDKDNYSIYFDLARCYRLQGQSQRADQMVEIGNGLKAKLEKENP